MQTTPIGTVLSTEVLTGVPPKQDTLTTKELIPKSQIISTEELFSGKPTQTPAYQFLPPEQQEPFQVPKTDLQKAPEGYVPPKEQGVIEKIASAAAQDAKTIGAGLFKGGSEAAGYLDFYAEIIGKAVSKVTGIPQEKLRGGIFKEMQDNAAYYSDKLKREGIQVPIMKDVLFGLGKAGVDIPSIMATPGPLKLATYGAMTGFKEGGIEGAATGAMSGQIMHGALKGVGGLSLPKKVAALFGFGAATTPGGIEEKTTGGATLAVLGINGSDLKNLIDRNPRFTPREKAEAKVEIEDDKIYEATKPQVDEITEVKAPEAPKAAEIAPEVLPEAPARPQIEAIPPTPPTTLPGKDVLPKIEGKRSLKKARPSPSAPGPTWMPGQDEGFMNQFEKMVDAKENAIAKENFYARYYGQKKHPRKRKPPTEEEIAQTIFERWVLDNVKTGVYDGVNWEDIPKNEQDALTGAYSMLKEKPISDSQEPPGEREVTFNPEEFMPSAQPIESKLQERIATEKEETAAQPGLSIKFVRTPEQTKSLNDEITKALTSGGLRVPPEILGNVYERVSANYDATKTGEGGLVGYIKNTIKNEAYRDKKTGEWKWKSEVKKGLMEVPATEEEIAIGGKPTKKVPREIQSEAILERTTYEEDPERTLSVKRATERTESLITKHARDEKTATAFRRHFIEGATKAEVGKELGVTEVRAGQLINSFRNKYLSTDSLLNELIQARHARKKEAEQKGPGGTVKMAGEKKTTTEPYQFPDPDIQAKVESAKVSQKPGRLERIKARAWDIAHEMTRTFRDLPETPGETELAVTKQQLIRQSKQYAIRQAMAQNAVSGLESGLDKNQRDLFETKVIWDDLAWTKSQGKKVPWDLSQEKIDEMKTDLDARVEADPKVKESVQLRQEVWDRAREDLTYWLGEIGIPNVDEKFKNPFYFRHKVIEYLDATKRGGKGKITVPRGGPHMMRREGSELPYTMNYLEVEPEILARLYYDTQKAISLYKIKEVADIYDKVRADAKEQGLENWEDAVPEGYRVYPIDPGRHFYQVFTIPEKVAKEAIEGLLAEGGEGAGIDPAKIKTALAMGAEHKPWVVREEIAKTLDNWGSQKKDPSFMADMVRGTTKVIRQALLAGPTTIAKYQIRNASGDADHAFVGNPTGFKYAPRAMKELFDSLVLKKPMTEDLRRWALHWGGMQSTSWAQETQNLGLFKKFMETEKGEKAKNFLDNINVFKKYWQQATIAGEMRESVLRYANYLSYKEYMDAHDGVPQNFGASNRKVIMSLPDNDTKAYVLQNELLGGYDSVTEAARNIGKVTLFWRWKEVNPRIYFGLFRNAVQDAKMAEHITKKIMMLPVKGPVMALRLARFGVKIAALQALAGSINLLNKEEEDELPPDVKGTVHLNLGKDSAGKNQYFHRLGAMTDLFEWVGGLDNISGLVYGSKNIRSFMKDMLRADANILGSAVTPVMKTPFELAFRQSLFPDIFNPAPIRDRGAYLARNLGLEAEYKVIAGLPHKPYTERLKSLLIYKSDPLESAYYQTSDIKNKYIKNKGKAVGFWVSPKSEAFYYLKQAHRYGDKDSEEKFLREYTSYVIAEDPKLGENKNALAAKVRSSIAASLRTANPFYGIPKKDQKGFIDKLTKDEKDIFARAIRFYNETIIGTTQADIAELLKENEK